MPAEVRNGLDDKCGSNYPEIPKIIKHINYVADRLNMTCRLTNSNANSSSNLNSQN